MNGIYWLASYPKSGNTWLRILLTNYLRDDDKPADINDLDIGGAFGMENINEGLGIDGSNLTKEQILKYRPLVHEQMAEEATEPLFLKIHDAFLRDAENRPIFTEKATGGVIYILRNPLDVVVSYAHHRNISIDKTIVSMNDDEHYLGGWKKNSGQLDQPVLSWSNHVKSWTIDSNLRTHIVRYEDMLQDTEKEFKNIIKFAGLDVDQKRITQAVEFSSFEKIKEQEQKSGFSEKQPNAKSFFRKGKSNSWRESLTETQIKQIISDHREMMERFGYLEKVIGNW